MRTINATVRVQRYSTVEQDIDVTLEVSDDTPDGPDLDAMIRAAAEDEATNHVFHGGDEAEYEAQDIIRRTEETT